MGTGVPPKRIATRNFDLSSASCRRFSFIDASHLFHNNRLLMQLPVCPFLQVNLRSVHPLICTLSSQLDKSTVMQPLLILFLRKEVIQPHLPIRLPCYDFTPVTGSTFGSSFLAVRSLTSGISDSHGVTGGVYKTRERIHRDILIRDY